MTDTFAAARAGPDKWVTAGGHVIEREGDKWVVITPDGEIIMRSCDIDSAIGAVFCVETEQ